MARPVDLGEVNQDCGMQLTDEPDKRCYPFQEILLCRNCHIKRLNERYPEKRFCVDPVTQLIKSIANEKSKMDGTGRHLGGTVGDFAPATISVLSAPQMTTPAGYRGSYCSNSTLGDGVGGNPNSSTHNFSPGVNQYPPPTYQPTQSSLYNQQTPTSPIRSSMKYQITEL